MSRQDKSISERHTRTLRDLVKRPENKVCADCKRNDPRWASWNLGVFLCIRCSGIHRSMGTHISKVKSVDLDIWTPEQMDSIQLWGNARANLYWEAHLKPGHVPAEHKMESFIRSKYESRRWALEGPPPKDPSVLENSREHYSEPAPPPPPPSSRTHAATAQPAAQRQPHMLLSAQTRSKPAPAQTLPAALPPATTAPAASVVSPQDDLFSLDFHGPAATAPDVSAGGQKDVKNDILSLFAASPPLGTGVLGGGSSNFGATQSQAQRGSTQPTSLMGNTGTGMWGAQSGWNGMAQAQSTESNVWGQPQPPQQQGPFGAFGGAPQPQNPRLSASQNVWGGSGPAIARQTGVELFSAPFSSTAPAQPVKKDDAFGDLWGSFK